MICNILILREQIVIPAGERKTVTYDSLVILVLAYIAETENNVDVPKMLQTMSSSISELRA
jgi:MINDY deubiquitinase